MDELKQKLVDYGVSAESVDIYLLLVRSGAQGIMFLTKESGLGRNVVYRLLSELQDAQLVSVAEKSFGKEYTARGAEALEAIVASKESEAAKLKASLDDVVAGLQAIGGGKPSKVVHFYGVEGLKQVNWNLTRTKGMFRVYEQSHVDEYLDAPFAERLRERFARNQIKSRDLTNKKYVNFYMTGHEDHWRELCDYRYISPDVLDIQFEMMIYNDVTALLDYSADRPHCVEIHNEKLAQMQKQIYDALWVQAAKMSLNADNSRTAII